MNRFREVIKKKVFNNDVVIVKNIKSHLSNKWLYVMFYSGVKHFEYQQLCPLCSFIDVALQALHSHYIRDIPKQENGGVMVTLLIFIVTW